MTVTSLLHQHEAVEEVEQLEVHKEGVTMHHVLLNVNEVSVSLRGLWERIGERMWVVMIYHDLSWLITAEGDIKALEKDFESNQNEVVFGEWQYWKPREGCMETASNRTGPDWV